MPLNNRHRVDPHPAGAKRVLRVAEGAAVSLARPHSGKRRRTAGGDAYDDGGGAAADREGAGPAARPRAAEPLRGLVVAVTAASERTPREDPGPSAAEPHYQDIAQLCQAAGATVVRQVHKRVNCVVATQSAADAATQRIRKAHSKGISVVKVQWIVDCMAAARLLAYNDYLFPVEEEPSRLKKIDVRKKLVDALKANDEKASHSDASPANAPAQVLDLGCCCACHETAETNCPWCTDCSVNQSSAQR